MKLKTVFTTNAILCFIFGIGFTLFPILTGSLFGITFTEPTAIPVRVLGAAFLGIGIMLWLVRNEPESNFRRAMVTASVVMDTVGLISLLFAQLSGFMNNFGWFLVGSYWYFCFVYWYYYFYKSSEDPFDD